MLDEISLREALERHWEYSGKDEDISHEIYHDDAVLEFPQSGERVEGVENFREWRRRYRRTSIFGSAESGTMATSWWQRT